VAIKGSLAEAALPNVIQLLTLSLKSGCLSVTDGKNFGNIFIKNGKIIYATIINRKQRLGDVLVSKNVIDKDALSTALHIQKTQKKKRIGEILIEIGAIKRETLEQELKEQIQQTIFTLLKWESGFFNFEADLLPSLEEYTVELSPPEVLLEAARRIDEWRKIEHKMPPFETVLIPKENAHEVPLTVQEQQMRELIDGTRSIDEVLRLSEFEFFETCRAIYGLMSAGLLEQPKEPTKKEPVSISEIKNVGFGFYKSGLYNDAEREFKRILEIDDGDAESLMYLGLIEVRRRNYKNARMNFLKSLEKDRRPSVLLNLGYVCNWMKLYDEAVSYLQEAQKLVPDDPKVQCNVAITFYRQNVLDEAYEIFKQVHESSPDFITPYIYLSIIHAQRRKTEDALCLLEEALSKYPECATFKNNLAVLYESIGRNEEAEKLYREALELDSQNFTVCRNLADFYHKTEILGAAKELYEKIPEDKWDWRILFKLGNIYLRQGSPEQALQFWERARVLNPSEEIITQNIELLQRASEK
jgi:tetratricopeptide (TPR) repeat protein